MIIQPTVDADLKPLLEMLRVSGQFDEDGLHHVSEKLETFFKENTEEFWLSARMPGLVGVAYCAPEVMTKGTWNLYLLWINPSNQRQGVGQALLEKIEQKLKNTFARLLIVETSSLANFSGARNFYEKRGFRKEATICNFYAQGEDKIIYTKAL